MGFTMDSEEPGALTGPLLLELACTAHWGVITPGVRSSVSEGQKILVATSSSCLGLFLLLSRGKAIIAFLKVECCFPYCYLISS